MALIEVNFGKPDVQGNEQSPAVERGLPAGVPAAAALISALTGTGG
jgi:hypothetical protein